MEAVENLYGFYYDDNVLQGFIGVDGQKAEMLFIHADARGHGAGKQLLRFAVTDLGARYIDVNEQAVEFYGQHGLSHG